MYCNVFENSTELVGFGDMKTSHIAHQFSAPDNSFDTTHLKTKYGIITIKFYVKDTNAKRLELLSCTKPTT